MRPLAAMAVACSVCCRRIFGWLCPRRSRLPTTLLLASEVSELMLPGADLTGLQ